MMMMPRCLIYQWKYLVSFLLSKFFSRKPSTKRILFVTHTSTKGWILGAKAARLSQNYPGASDVLFTKKFLFLPRAGGYFFLHQKYFARALKYNPWVWKCKNVVMFTHPEWSKRYSAEHIVYVLNFADRVICLNHAMANDLELLGVRKEKLVVFYLASNPEMFTPKERRGDGAVGFCMGYYERKNPGLMIDLVKNMPDKKFILTGRDWDRYERFKEISGLSNFSYYDNIPYKEYPAMYHKMDVFVSPSYLEGGPVPLLEAMLSNVIPVVSRTGFGPDLVKHGENGFLFNATDDVNDVILLIRKAFELNINVRHFAEPHSWLNYGKKISELFQEIAAK